MILCKVKFKTKNEENKIDYPFVYLFMQDLYANGQIDKEYHIIKENNYYQAYVLLTGIDAIKDEYFSPWALKEKEKFDISFFVKAFEDECNKECCCESRSGYFLTLNDLCFDGIIICKDCMKKVPLYKIKKATNEDFIFELVELKETYEELNGLRIKKLYSEFGENELKNNLSIFNKKGITLSKMLSKYLKKDVYYLINNPTDGVEEFGKENQVSCPNCKELLVNSNKKDRLENKINICEKCKFAFNEY